MLITLSPALCYWMSFVFGTFALCTRVLLIHHRFRTKHATNNTIVFDAAFVSACIVLLASLYTGRIPFVD